MISMKPIIALFANILCLPVMAQRDFGLTEQRNAWLTSGNAAALVTLKDSTIAQASLGYRHEGGALRTLSEGRRVNSVNADVRSYYRLSPSIVAYGSMTYDYSNGTNAAGSMLFPSLELKPFDLIDDSISNAGDKRKETFRASGAIGWTAWRNISVGARVDYTAGTYAKHRDLRHSNTLMDLNTRLNAFLSLPDNSAIGVGFVYRRRTETMLFKTYGTTDRIYSTLIDYANHQGEVEMFGTEGFTDGNRELPLLSEYVGFTAQGAWNRLFADMTYTHQTGYYGRQSQYTASHEQHCGDAFMLHLRYDLARNTQRLLWIDAIMTTEQLTSERENYRKTTTSDGTAATYYEYFQPTKMADKAQTYGTAAVTAYWKPAGAIFLWHVKGGVNYWTRRQTAYVFPDTYTAKRHVIAPFITAKHGILTHNSSLWTAQLGCSLLTGSAEQFAANAALAYEMPVQGTQVRPSLTLSYDFRTATGGDMKGLTRNVVSLTAAATF